MNLDNPNFYKGYITHCKIYFPSTVKSYSVVSAYMIQFLAAYLVLFMLIVFGTKLLYFFLDNNIKVKGNIKGEKARGII